MADVPTGNFVPTTTPTALPDNMQSIDATPDAFGAAGADAQAKLGSGLSQASDDANTVGQQVLNLQNQTKANDAVNALQSAMNKEMYGDPSDPNAPPGFMSLQGQSAINAYGQSTQRIEALRDSLAESLPMSVAASFNEDTRRLVNSTLSEAGSKVIEAQKQWADTSFQQSMDTSTNTILLNRDNQSILNQSLTQRDALIATRGQQLGLTPDQITAAQSNDRSTTLTQVIMAKAQQDPQVAYSFYQQNKGALTAADQLDIESKLRDPVNATAAGNDADTLAAGGTPATSPSSPVSPAQLAPAIVQEANAQGVDPKLALATAQVESGLGAHTSAPGSRATGVFGMEPPTFQDMGGGNANDVGTQVHHGVAYLKIAQQAADAAVGGTAENWQTYAVYQQGTAGGPALLKADPNASALDVLTRAYKGNRDTAASAITGNGGTTGMSVGQFLGRIRSTYSSAEAGVGDTTVTPSSITPGPDDVTPTIVPGTPAGGSAPLTSLSAPVTTAGGSSASATLTGDGYPILANASLNDQYHQALAKTTDLVPPGGGNPDDYQQAVRDALTAKFKQAQLQLDQQAAQSKSVLNGYAGGVAPDGSTISLPTTLQQLFQLPGAQSAWASADGDTRAAVLNRVKANANQDPPVTQQSTSTYYQLRGEAVNDPETFARENLADPAFLTSMPRAQVNELIGLQASVAKNDKDQQQRQVASQHQLAVMTPDLLAAGIDPKKAATDPAIRANLLSFTGQLQEGVAKFMAANKGQAPDDDQIKAMGETLLTPGYLKGTGSLWGLLSDDTSAPLYQASASGKSSRFYPNVPQADRQQIIAAYGARYKGAVPTDAQIQAYYMAGRQPPAQPGPRTTLIKSRSASPFASAAPATGTSVNAGPAPTSDQAEQDN